MHFIAMIVNGNVRLILGTLKGSIVEATAAFQISRHLHP
ncbi:hypothetical protein OIHEL45_20506 [Sulfitobacter indolifex HEL-45]|uniref:Uncharacterized protein n=1 Tax=Sulfitobacter indolifex HEL-45 TaxID=391624 RepID=A0ABM9X0N2_9RHOB|nr:hypothetical protein OIHEL45_20506 [Sulfitobacter indolifex HEL-45]